MKCPSCNKFCGLEMQDPEVNDVTLHNADAGDDLDGASVTVEVRIVRNSECCGDECKEYTFDTEVDVPQDIINEMKKARETDPEVEFSVEETSTDMTEEGGHRYKKSYYGFSMTVTVYAETSTTPRTEAENAELAKLNAVDYINRSAADKARISELTLIGRPKANALGVVTVEDKVEASGMDEMC